MEQLHKKSILHQVLFLNCPSSTVIHYTIYQDFFKMLLKWYSYAFSDTYDYWCHCHSHFTQAVLQYIDLCISVVLSALQHVHSCPLTMLFLTSTVLGNKLIQNFYLCSLWSLHLCMSFALSKTWVLFIVMVSSTVFRAKIALLMWCVESAMLCRHFFYFWGTVFLRLN
jgi:hypothetical protein